MKQPPKGPKPRKDYSKLLAGILAALVATCYFLSGPSESSLRERVVKLKSEHGSCSGEQVRAPSGVDYILTAGHCKVLEENGSILAATDSGNYIPRKVIAEDANSDLLLLEGIPGIKGISVASSWSTGEHVRTFTHGHGFKTYKSEGELIDKQHIDILIDLIASDADKAACTGEKYKVVDLDTPFGKFTLCTLSVDEVVTTAFISPGSSGGMVVNDDGALVGVVSAGGDSYGFLVPISEVHSFLAGY